jgi:hypothetical protein
MKKILLTFFLLFILNGFSQEKKSNYLQLNYFHGKTLLQKNIEHLATGPTGFLLSWNQRTFGEKKWQQDYNYPDFGFSFGYIDFNNKNLDKLYGLYAHHDFHLSNRNAAHKFLLSIGAGIAYNTKPYDKITNNKNISLGSHLNLSPLFKIYYAKENIIENIGLQTGFTFIHASNGSSKSPNKGINVYGFNVGLNYNLNSENKEFIVFNDKKKYQESIHFNATILAGVNESDNIDSGAFPFFILSSYVDKRLNRKSALQLGVELHLHYYLREHIKFQNIFNGNINETNHPDWKRVSLILGHELFLNKTSIITQFGYYVYSPFKQEGNFYERVGVKRYFKNSYFASISIKAHLYNAEGLEFGFGYRF